METSLGDDLQLQRVSGELEFTRAAPLMPERPARKRVLELVAMGEEGVARHLMLEWLNGNQYDENDLETMSLLEAVEGKKKENGEWCRILLEQYPSNVIGLELRLEQTDDGKYTQSSEDTVLKLLQIQPSNEVALSFLTRRAMKFREWHDASEHSEVLLRINSGNRFALLSSARASSALGERDKAADFWERVGAVAEFSDDEIIEASRAIYNARRYSRVIDVLQPECEGNSFSLEMMELLIRAQYSLGLSEECANSSVRILDSEPENSIGLRYLSRSLIQLGRLRESIPIMENHCELEPTTANIWESLIETHLRMDRTDSASKTWARLEAKSRKSLQLFFTAAEVAVKFHWQKEYDSLVESGGRLFPDGNGYIEGLARINLDVGDVSRSWGLLTENGINPSETVLKGTLENILITTSTTEEELDEAVSKKEGLWVAELVTREVFRRAVNRREIRPKRPKCHMISSSLDRGGAERQVALTLRHTADRFSQGSSSFDCALAVHSVEGRAGLGSYMDELGAASERVFRLDEIDLMEPSIAGYEIIQENSDLLGLLGTNTKKKVEQLISHFAEHQPDLIHAWQDETILTASIAAALTGIPRVVGSARSLRPDEKTELHIRKRPYLRNCFRVIFGNEGHYLSTNSEAGRKSYSDWLGLNPKVVGVNRNGVDFQDMEARIGSEDVEQRLREFGISDNEIIVGGVFRLEAGKRPELWLEAFDLARKREPLLRGLLVGGGRMEGSVKEWIKQKGMIDAVHLVGESNDVAAWLIEMDVFLFTSITEGLPNVLIEAQGFGLPVVSTNVGGVSEVVQDGHTGILVSSASAVDLSQAIMKLLESPNLGEMREKSISNARNNFSIRSMVRRTEEMYSRVLFPSRGG